MSKLEKLIKELCPDGVEYVELGSCLVSNRGGGTPSKSKPEYWNGDIPWASIKDIVKSNYYLNETQQYITEEGLKNSSSNIIEKGDIIVATRIVLGKMVIANKNMAINQDLRGLILRDFLDAKFLLYFFETIHIEGNGTTVKGISVKDLEKIKIPLPPLPVQREIVRILDNFTELTAELTARKKQYEYYKYKLLDENGQSRKIKLKEVAQYSKTRIVASDVCDENYVGVDNLLQDKQGKTISNFTPSAGNLTQYNMGDILVGNIRPYLKKIWFATNVGGASGDVLVIQRNSADILERYLYMVLSTDEFFRYNMQNAKGAKMPRGNKEAIMDYEFSLPTIEEQEKIIDILDRFDLLCNDVLKGLPAEIEARKQQYEYYRDKLLSFKTQN